jgi:cobalt-zinc-cadmium efflux system outer membrane protein
VRIAVEGNPQVLAARSRLAEADAALRGARSHFGVQAEIAPGGGYTNGNALLSHRLDFGGRISAESRKALADRDAALADLASAQLRVAAESRMAYFDAVRAKEAEKVADDSLSVVRQIGQAVKRRVEIGEAPAVQATRAEVEVARVEQDVLRLRGERLAREATLNLLLGRPANSPLTLADTLSTPSPPGETVPLIERALRERPDLLAARSRVEGQKGAVAMAKAEGRPDAFAEVASDTWSLDRQPFQGRNLGAQLRIAFPLLDGGRLRAGVHKALAVVNEREADLKSLELAARIEIEQAVAELTSAREIVSNYRSTIVPRTEELLAATRSGFETGLSSFVDVLDAQRVSRQIRSEYLAALHDAVRARIGLDLALGAVPGLPSARPRRQ